MTESQQEESLLKDQIFYYLRYWTWFFLSVIVAVALAFLYLRYSTNEYRSEATILIKDEKKGALSELAAFEDFGLAGGGLSKSDFENEIEILKSRRLISRVVKELDLTTRYYKLGSIKSSEVFDDKLFRAGQIAFKDTTDQVPKELLVNVLSPSSFEIKRIDEGDFKSYAFGEKLIFEDFSFTLLPGSQKLVSEDGLDDQDYRISISSTDRTISALRNALQIQPVNKNSSVVSIALVDGNIGKSEAILNTLVDAYNNDAIQDRNQISKSTADFIDKRLAIITQELDSVEIGKVAFRQENRITDIQAEGQLFLENASAIQRQQLELETKLDMAQSMAEYLQLGNNNDLIPAAIGVDAGASNVAINNYNELVLERKRLLQSSTEENPVVVAVTEQIEELRGNVLDNLSTVQSSLRIQNNDLKRQLGSLGGELSKIPGVAKDARAIERQQTIKEQLYLYLLEKREETAISLAVTAPKAKIVDYAYSSVEPVSPKPQIVYLSSLVLGLLLPFGFLYAKQLLDTKIHNRLEVEKEVPTLPILGEIPTVDDKESEVITSNDRSVLAEAFRILRTNLSYFIKTKGESKNNIIFVTSTVKGEGKTFVAYNLALTLASTKKSVLLIGADIRNPQLHRYIDKDQWATGLSEYLFDPNVTLEAISHEVSSDQENFNLILSGRIPPNPAELLMNKKFDELVEKVRHLYDYVIIDTAPTLLVTDTLLISQKADMTVYVCRADYTDRKLLQYPKELIDEGKLKNVAFVINGIKITNFGYGSKYGYGYGYGQDKPSFLQRIKQSLGIKS